MPVLYHAPTSKKGIVPSLVLAIVLSLLARATVFSDFGRVNLEGTVEGSAVSGFTNRFVLAQGLLNRRGPWLLFLRIRAEGQKQRTAAVFLNGTPVGSVPFGSRNTTKAHLEVPDSFFRPGENNVVIRAGDQDWRAEEIRLNNYYGYSSGIFKLIVVPKASRAYQRLSWIAAAGLLAVLLVVGILPRMVPAIKGIDRVTAIFRILFVGMFALAAGLPFVTKWRLLYSTKTLALFVLASNLSIVVAFLKSFFGWTKRQISFLRSLFIVRELETAPRKRLIVSLILPAVVCLFFFSYMGGILKDFKGNYSRFLRIDDERLGRFERLYLTSSSIPLFENSDFEKGTLQNWTQEGNAFLHQPVRQENLDANNRRLYINSQGLYWVGTYDKNEGASQGDDPSGRLVSAGFVIQHEKIGFLIGGGRNDPARGLRESVGLEVGGKIVLEEGGLNRDMMRTFIWDVRPWLGQTARIIITDGPSSEIRPRHINADWFHYYRENWLLKSIVPQENYDGQFNFFMAFDPFLSKYKTTPRTYRLIVDEPAYRFGRIGFPLLVKLFSLDNLSLYPKTIIWLIVASHLFGTFFLLKIILVFKKNPLWTFLYLLVPGFYYSLSMGLPESMGMAFLLAGMFCYLKERVPWTAALFAVSFLFRETGFLVAVAIMGFEMLQKRNFRRALLIGSSAVPYFLWRVFLTIRLFEVTGWRTLFFSPGDFTVPFMGFKDLLTQVVKGDYAEAIVPAAIGYPILLTVIFVLSLVIFFRQKNIFSLCLLLYSLLSVSLNYVKIWVGVGNGIRGTFEVFVFLILAFLSRKEDWTPRLKYAVVGLWVGVFLFQFMVMDMSNYFRNAWIFW